MGRAFPHTVSFLSSRKGMRRPRKTGGRFGNKYLWATGSVLCAISVLRQADVRPFVKYWRVLSDHRKCRDTFWRFSGGRHRAIVFVRRKDDEAVRNARNRQPRQ